MLIWSALPGPSQAVIQDVPKQYPAAFKAYQRIVPTPFRRADWVYHPNAKADDLEILTFAERDTYLPLAASRANVPTIWPSFLPWMEAEPHGKFNPMC